MKNWNENWVAGARRFALAAHGDQKYGNAPYIDHLDDVSRLVINYGHDYQVLAYLHDVLEDSKTTYESIEEKFGKEMADNVVLLTNPQDKVRHNRVKSMYVRLSERHVPDIVITVKVADRLANLRSANNNYLGNFIKLYRKEQTEFRSALYRYRVCDDLWTQLEAEIIREKG